MNAVRHNWLAAALACACLALAASCGAGSPQANQEAEAGEYERGPHRGRMLRDGDFAVEITIFEDGVDPQFRVYPYLNDRPLDPRQVQLAMSLTRLGGQVDQFAFQAQEDFLLGAGVVTEPHSFDVAGVARPVRCRHRPRPLRPVAE